MVPGALKGASGPVPGPMGDASPLAGASAGVTRRRAWGLLAPLIIDRKGVIRFYSLLDSANFDAKLIALRARLDEVLAEK